MAPERVIVITGPTASGKSALAIALARGRQGTVINADAMQTYDAFPILTAQPTERERADVLSAHLAEWAKGLPQQTVQPKRLAPGIEKGLNGNGYIAK